MKKFAMIFFICLFFNSTIIAQYKTIVNRLKGLDEYMENIMGDWNTPGIGIGIVYKAGDIKLK